MKVALIGTHGTGKTTLGYELVFNLKKKNVDADFLGETARICPFQINEEVSKNAQEWIILSQYIREIEMNRQKVLVCDRSVLDGYVYYVNKFGRNEWIEKFVKEKIHTYDLLFKIPIREGYLKEDMVRSTNKKFQTDINKKFDCLLNELNIPFINYESLNKTLEIILKKL